jgi:hypothetical protein
MYAVLLNLMVLNTTGIPKRGSNLGSEYSCRTNLRLSPHWLTSNTRAFDWLKIQVFFLHTSAEAFSLPSVLHDLHTQKSLDKFDVFYPNHIDRGKIPL